MHFKGTQFQKILNKVYCWLEKEWDREVLEVLIPQKATQNFNIFPNLFLLDHNFLTLAQKAQYCSLPKHLYKFCFQNVQLRIFKDLPLQDILVHYSKLLDFLILWRTFELMNNFSNKSWRLLCRNSSQQMWRYDLFESISLRLESVFWQLPWSFNLNLCWLILKLTNNRNQIEKESLQLQQLFINL